MSRQPRIGQRLAAARLRRGRSQAAVAHDAGIAPSYLSRIETSKVQPTFRTLARIARAIGMQFDELAEFETKGRKTGGKCPISEHGSCLLDLIRSDSKLARERHADFFTVRQVKLLRRFAHWLQAIPPDRQFAMEILIEDLARAQGVPLEAEDQKHSPPKPR
jgi:transcriptional regulator with XRE-family HTH domain